MELAKAYYKALTASVRKHFKGNGVIASMEHCNDFMFLGTEAIALGRVGTSSFRSIKLNFISLFTRKRKKSKNICIHSFTKIVKKTLLITNFYHSITLRTFYIDHNK